MFLTRESYVDSLCGVVQLIRDFEGDMYQADRQITVFVDDG